jgi:hypothetical protein
MTKILIDEAVVRQALEALTLNNSEWEALADSDDAGYWKAKDQEHYKQSAQSIASLRVALVEPVQEPFVIHAMFETVASHPYGATGTTSAPVKRVEHNDDGSLTVVINHWPTDDLRSAALQDLAYINGVKAGWNAAVSDDRAKYASLTDGKCEALQALRATQPAKRVPLRDKEIMKIYEDCDEGGETIEFTLAFARAIEAAHGASKE